MFYNMFYNITIYIWKVLSKLSFQINVVEYNIQIQDIVE